MRILLFIITFCITATAGLRFLTPIKGGVATKIPSDISGLTFWVDANDGTTINTGSPANNDPVDNWNDKSGSGFNFTQALTKRPVYKTNQIGGKPAITFATGQCLVNATGKLLGANESAPFTIIMAVNNGTYSSNYAFLFSFYTNIASDGPQFGFSANAGLANVFFAAATTAGKYNSAITTAAFASQNTAYIVGLTYDGSAASTGYQWYSSGVSKTTIAGSDNSNNNVANYMAAADVSCSLANGELWGEMTIWNKGLNATEISQMQTYYHGKWGI